MKKFKSLFRKKQTLTIVTVLIVGFFILIGGKKVFDYAAPPTGEKDCDFIFPNIVDQTKSTTILINTPEDLIALQQKGGVINDASCLNQTSVYGISKITSIDDIKSALQFARKKNLKVTSAGQHHSMGGQSFIQNGLVLDMRDFNQIKLDREHRILNAQAGATWMQIQQFLDKEGLAVQAMQSMNIFTVGGTLSVNAHGIAHKPGPVASTVKSVRIMLSNGEIKTASLSENPELFKSALGGYGLFGVILDADIEVVDNEVYQRKIDYINYVDFPEYYRRNIENNDQVRLTYSRISVSPSSFLTETAVHTFTKIRYGGEIPALKPDEQIWLTRLAINFSKTGSFGRWVRWTLEKYAQPGLDTCLSRNQAMSQGDVCLVSRNQQMHNSMGYLKNRLKDTDILQEYFIPPEKMPSFVDGLRTIVKAEGANLLNVTVRVVHQDTVTALPYAKQDMFALVLYFNQKLNEKESKILQKTTTDLIDLAIGLDGTYYLPYQLYYSPEQLNKAYPEIDGVFATKIKYDPIGLFDNKFYEKYGK
jgi:FAD/FMN-containing dehydrogenase